MITRENLITLLAKTQEAHHLLEEELGHPDHHWVSWYAKYIAEAIGACEACILTIITLGHSKAQLMPEIDWKEAWADVWMEHLNEEPLPDNVVVLDDYR